MEVICIQKEALYELIRVVVEHVKSEHPVRAEKWISEKEAMHTLRIKSKVTLFKWRKEGKIRYTQPESKIILYDIDSLYEFLEHHVKEPF